MIKAFQNIVGMLLYWSDVLIIGAYALIGIAALFLGLSFWGSAQLYFNATGFPIGDYQNLDLLKGWVFSLVNTTLLQYVAYAWGYLCATGFSFTVSALILHEAIIRLRVRLG